MFSYRHAYHAGNHADVLKHLCQMMIIDRLKAKSKPFVYMDSHSGGGLYRLDSEMASKNSEFKGGIDRLIASAPDNPDIAAYLEMIGVFRERNEYPGSPAIASHLLREQDKLCLMEWHNNEYTNLQQAMYKDRRAACHHRDGYEGLVAMTPPVPARGMILIDPPYELPEDYHKVVKTIDKVHKRWPGGTIALWYPLLARKRDKTTAMLEALKACGPANLFVAELCIKDQDEELGMHGSGMAVINLPWQLDDRIDNLLPMLHQAVAESGQGGYRAQWLIEAQ